MPSGALRRASRTALAAVRARKARAITHHLRDNLTGQRASRDFALPTEHVAAVLKRLSGACGEKSRMTTKDTVKKGGAVPVCNRDGRDGWPRDGRAGTVTRSGPKNITVSLDRREVTFSREDRLSVTPAAVGTGLWFRTAEQITETARDGDRNDVITIKRQS